MGKGHLEARPLDFCPLRRGTHPEFRDTPPSRGMFHGCFHAGPSTGSARADGATPVQWLPGIIIPSAEQVLANPTFFDAGAPQCNLFLHHFVKKGNMDNRFSLEPA